MPLLNSKHVIHFNAKRGFIVSLFSSKACLAEVDSIMAGPTRDAPMMFDKIPARDYRFYNALIKSHGAQSQHVEALSAFKWMRNTNCNPDCFALAVAIKASGVLFYEILGKSIHAFIVKASYDVLLPVRKALMDMYSRIGALDYSYLVFESISQKDSVSWNVMLAGLARAELYFDAMEMLYLMHSSGEMEVKLTAITMAIVLPICAKLKLLKHGKCIHACIIKSGLEFATLVGNSLASMYAKCAAVNDAWVVFDMISNKDIISWNSMIAGLSENGFYAEALRLFYQMPSVGIMVNDVTIVSILPVCSFLENGIPMWSSKLSLM